MNRTIRSGNFLSRVHVAYLACAVYLHSDTSDKDTVLRRIKLLDAVFDLETWVIDSYA